MAFSTAQSGGNFGFQVRENHANINAVIVQSESPLNQQCLRDLRVTDPYADKARIQSASGGLLEESYRWILENEEFKRWQDNEGSLLWIKGDPGKGKTMLLCGIIDELSKSGSADSIISFFCQATDVRINSATAVLRGLIYSLVLKRPSLLSHVRTEHDQAGKQLFEDVNAWHALANILSGILKDLSNTYLVVDALDECMIGLSPLLDFISQQPTLNSGVRWIVSSRNWPEINERLRDTAGITPISLELNEACIPEAVKGFVQYKVAELAKLKKYDEETRDKIDAYLLENSQNTFLWVSLVCQELSRCPVWQAVQRLNDLPPGLNALYDRMMDQIHMLGDAELCRRIFAAMSIVHRPITLAELRYCVDLPEAFAGNSEATSDMIAFCGSFLTLQNNIIVFVHNSAKDFIFSKALSAIFPNGVEAEHHQIFVRCFKAIFNVLRRDIFDVKFPNIPVKLVPRPNPSPLAAAEYACVYWADHLQQYSGTLIQNGDLEDAGTIDKFLQQSYLHWIEALSLLGSISEGIAAMLKLDSLLLKLSRSQELVDRAYDALRFLRYFKGAIEYSPLQVYCSALIFSPDYSMTKRCYRAECLQWVAMVGEAGIQEHWDSCLQILTANCQRVSWHNDKLLASICGSNLIEVFDPETGKCISTIDSCSQEVSLLAWSYDGSRLASAGYDDGTIEIWDPDSGTRISKLNTKATVISINWSPSDTRLGTLSSTEADVLRIWNTDTGNCIAKIGSSLSSVGRFRHPAFPCRFIPPSRMKAYSFAWSHEGALIALALVDRIEIWNTKTLQRSANLVIRDLDSIVSMTWLPGGSRLLLKSHSDLFLWNLSTSNYEQGIKVINLPGWGLMREPSFVDEVFNKREYLDIDFICSKDGSKIALWSGEFTAIYIWDSTIEKHTSKLEISTYLSSPPKCISWSPDETRLACGYWDSTIKVWHVTTGKCIFILKGHTEAVSSIFWSEDGSRLLSKADDQTIRVWETPWRLDESDGLSDLREDHARVITIAWSPNGRRLASVANDGKIYPDPTISIWDRCTGECIWRLESHQISVIGSSPFDQIAWSPNGTWLASPADGIIMVWDTLSDEYECLYASSNSALHEFATYFAWSPSGSKIASVEGLYDSVIRIWKPSTGEILSTLEVHDELERLIVTWSSDEARLASLSNDRIKVWETSTNQCIFFLRLESCDWLRFNSYDSNILHTQVGTLDIRSNKFEVVNSGSEETLPRKNTYGLSKNRTWITFNGQYLLWLPPGYRPQEFELFAVSGNSVAMGYSTGHVLFLNFSDMHPT